MFEWENSLFLWPFQQQTVKLPDGITIISHYQESELNTIILSHYYSLYRGTFFFNFHDEILRYASTSAGCVCQASDRKHHEIHVYVWWSEKYGKTFKQIHGSSFCIMFPMKVQISRNLNMVCASKCSPFLRSRSEGCSLRMGIQQVKLRYPNKLDG